MPITSASLPVLTGVLAAVVTVLTYFGSRRALIDCQLEVRRTPVWTMLAGGVLSACLTYSAAHGWQQTPEVIPSEIGWWARLFMHQSLLVLIMMIIATDLREYYILEWNCWLGVAIALITATATGDAQLAHIWVDWNAEVPQIRGPYLPDWLSQYPHLHGLAWSLAGAVVGAILTALTRWISSSILMMNTLGTGDIYLMAMIGAYLGWQPTLVAFALAPVFALGVGGAIKLSSNRPALPYGPFLGLGAIATMLIWRSIWMLEIQLGSDPVNVFAVRRFFGDPVALGIVFGLSTGLFVLLIGLIRIYRSLPLGDRDKVQPADDSNQ